MSPIPKPPSLIPMIDRGPPDPSRPCDHPVPPNGLNASGEISSDDEAALLNAARPVFSQDSHLDVYRQHSVLDDFEALRPDASPLPGSNILEENNDANEYSDSSCSSMSIDSDSDANDEEGEGSADLNQMPQLPDRFTSLHSCLNDPINGLAQCQARLESAEADVAELKMQKHHIKKLLRDAKEHRRNMHQKMSQAKQNFQALQTRLGISDELWTEYEAFCESLEPQFGSEGGWSVQCFGNHWGSYTRYDPELQLFKDTVWNTVGETLAYSNFRCEASTKPNPSIPGGVEYLVEFWPVPTPEPRTGTEITWGEQYPNLYRLALKALYDMSRPNTDPASQLLKTLPEKSAPFAGGWLFEYGPDPCRSQHPVISRRWRYQSAHQFDIWQCRYAWTESGSDAIVSTSESDDEKSDEAGDKSDSSEAMATDEASESVRAC